MPPTSLPLDDSAEDGTLYEEDDEQIVFRDISPLGLVEQMAKFISDELHKPCRFEILKRRRVRRNEACPCGSGKKFKSCCAQEGDQYVIDADFHRKA